MVIAQSSGRTSQRQIIACTLSLTGPEETQSRPMEIVDTLGFLRGTWEIERSIEDHRARIRGSFKGSAILTEMSIGCDVGLGARARYTEVGELRFGSHTGQARRTLEYRQLADMTVMVYFANGTPYVHLDLGTGAWQTDHLCGDDRHEISTFVRSDSIVEERWRVRGPATNYEAITMHTRVG